MQNSKELFIVIFLTLVSLILSLYWSVIATGLYFLIIFYLLFRSYRSKYSINKIDYPVSEYRVADTVMLINSNGVILDCNNQALPMFGYQKSEVIGQSIEFLMDKSLHHQHVGLRNRFFITSGQRRMQNRVWALHKSGKRVHVEVYLEISAAGNQANVICSIRDIEKYWQRESELLAENRILKSTQDAKIGIVHVTLSGHFIMTNPYFSQLLGFNAEEFKSLSLHELVHENDIQKFSDAHNNLLNQGPNQTTFEVRLKNIKNHFIWVSVQASFYKNESDTSHFTWVITDRSELMALQKNVSKIEFEIEAIINNALEQTSVWVSIPGMNYISRINSNFTKLWGLNISDLQSNPRLFLKQVHPDDLNRVHEIYQGHLRGGWHIDYRIITPAGKTKHISEFGKLIPATDEHPGLLICTQKYQ